MALTLVFELSGIAVLLMGVNAPVAGSIESRETVPAVLTFTASAASPSTTCYESKCKSQDNPSIHLYPRNLRRPGSVDAS